MKNEINIENHENNIVIDMNKIEKNETTTHELKKDGSKRVCDKCKIFKPDRTHHCSVCKQCILRMDHHCPWVNNCVGYHNHKYFYLFVFYTMIGCFYTVFTLAYPILKSIWQVIPKNGSEFQLPGILELAFFWIAFLAGTFSCVLTCFVGFHTKLILTNSTTLEDMSRFSSKNPYDISYYENWKMIFGTKAFFWFFPTRMHCLGNGYNFAINQDSKILISKDIEDSSENSDDENEKKRIINL